MNKGISDWLFRHTHSGESLIRLAGEAGFDGVEFNLYEDELYGPIHLKTPLKILKLMSVVAQDCGLQLPSLSTSLHNNYSLTSHNRLTRERGIEIARSMIEIASVLGAKTILIVPGHVDANVPYDAAYALAQEALLRIASEARATGITIAIENVWSRFLLSPLEFARFLDELNDPAIRAYLDVGNAVHAGYPEQWIRILGSRISGVHMKDMRLAEGGMGLQASPFFEGEVNWLKVIRALRDISYEGFLIATPSLNFTATDNLMRFVSKDLSTIIELK
jgi:L-ribulose-5-phosphate 3-epimerase